MILTEFQNYWAQIRIPDSIDLEKEMQQAGLTMMEQIVAPVKRPMRNKANRSPQQTLYAYWLTDREKFER